MLQLKNRRGQLRTQARSHFPTPREAFTNGHISKADLLIKPLQQAARVKQWRGRKVCLSMDSRACYMRMLTLPPLKKGELKQAIFWEARKHLPFNPEDAVISYMPVDPGPDGVQKYLLAATLKETANQYTSLALQAGFKPLSLEPPATAWLRSIAGHPLLEESKAADCRLYLDCGYSATTLLMTVNGSYGYHRFLHPGIYHFCRAAGTEGKSDLSEALRLVYDRRGLSEKGLLAEAEKLLHGVVESLAYWSDLNREASLKPAAMALSGGGLLIPGLASYLQQNLDLALSFFDPFRANGAQPLEKKSGRRGELTPLFATAHGLAIRGWLR